MTVRRPLVLSANGIAELADGDSIHIPDTAVSDCTYEAGRLITFVRGGVTFTYVWDNIGPDGAYVPVTLIGGSVTRTYSYNDLGQFIGEVIS